MKIVNQRMAVKVHLVPPTQDGFILFAAEIGTWIGPFLPPNSTRSALLARLTRMATELARLPKVKEAGVFRGTLRPPGEGAQILNDRGRAHARYDIVVLIRTVDVATAKELCTHPTYREHVEEVKSKGRRTYESVACNDARIDDVDHRPNHPYLFNYFYAEDTETMRQVWEYTAGWFQAKTALSNSVLMRPLDGEPDYAIINHASWPSLAAFLPSLVFRPTFRSFVLANFKVNGIAAQPIIYRRMT